MVTRWGTGSLGPLAFAADEEQPFLGYQLSQGRDYSEATARTILGPRPMPDEETTGTGTPASRIPVRCAAEVAPRA